MISSWLIIVLFATLLIRVVANFAISRRIRNLSNVGLKKDLISLLPDDILVSIMARTPTRSAVRSSVLSKRWRTLYKSVPDIFLRCGDVVPHHSDSAVKIHKLETFFSRYSAGLKVPCICMQYCFKSKSHTHQLLESLGKLGVEKLQLWLSCQSGSSTSNVISFSACHVFHNMPSLKDLLLGSCSLQPNLETPLSNSSQLQTLHLTSVILVAGSLECILSNCLRLHSLYITECSSPSKLSFRGPDLQLKTLVIEHSSGIIEEIEIYASNLLTLEFRSRHHDLVNFIFGHVPNFIFDHAPLLQTFCFDPASKNVMSQVFGRSLAKDLPRLESFNFVTRGDFYQESRRVGRMGIERSTFSKLRRLELSLSRTPNTNLIALAPFLQSCPLLQEFHLNVYDLLIYDWGGAGAEDCRAGEGVHSELKKVEISGFVGTENEIEFCLYLLRSAIRLEKMLIGRCQKHYCGFGRWRRVSNDQWSDQTIKMIQQQLPRQSLSTTVIIQHAFY